MKYQVTITGTVDILVDAESPEEAETLALETEVGGELYDWEIDEVTEAA